MWTAAHAPHLQTRTNTWTAEPIESYTDATTARPTLMASTLKPGESNDENCTLILSAGVEGAGSNKMITDS